MAKSKKDLGRAKQNIRRKLDELEPKIKMDPLRRNRALHEEYEKLKKELEEY
jgi:hypothetical protein